MKTATYLGVRYRVLSVPGHEDFILIPGTYKKTGHVRVVLAEILDDGEILPSLEITSDCAAQALPEDTNHLGPVVDILPELVSGLLEAGVASPTGEDCGRPLYRFDRSVMTAPEAGDAGPFRLDVCDITEGSDIAVNIFAGTLTEVTRAIHDVTREEEEAAWRTFSGKHEAASSMGEEFSGTVEVDAGRRTVTGRCNDGTSETLSGLEAANAVFGAYGKLKEGRTVKEAVDYLYGQTNTDLPF